ncbi:hypothetical protein [Patulibacter sp.]|uniref:hypothetical protein n=1 Tax=Patulibacter sp. TaxID=1912859 RepID=UPI0027203716|nr:hypothetical protein [Patulibacter sp.]MDO9408270.1 hypothetical protein [Patulibacter sp.]
MSVRPGIVVRPPSGLPAPRAGGSPVRIAVLALALLLAVGGLGPWADRAAAAPTPAQVVRALERSPVYIDPALDGQISPTAAGRIEKAVERSGEDVKVALVEAPDGSGSAYARNRSFVTALRSRLSFDGILVTVDDRYIRVDERRDGRQIRRSEVSDAESLANYADEGDQSFDRTLLERVERFLANLRQTPQRLAARVAADEARSAAQRKATPRRETRGTDDGGGGLLPVLVGLVVVGLVVAVVLVRRRRRGALAADGPLPVVPARVFEHARAAERADLHEDADGELLALATLLDEGSVPRDERAQDAYQRALDAYTAARRRARDGAPTVDLVGVLVLVDRARGDLAAAAAIEGGGRPAAWTPLCTFHPLHGRSARTVRWERGLRVPACAACAADLRAGRDPDALRDGDRPYFEGDTVWAKTGYGAFGDDLVERVSRGE